MGKKQKIYAIVDIETTGGMAKRDKITEIGIVLHNGKEIINQYSSLINPERSIPTEITRITGITNDMVANAPKFYEIAKDIVLITEGAIFVAHNVNFDYSFIREEFDRLGYSFSRKQLCTVKLSRKAFPGLRSYSLGNLIQHFGINVKARHRALDDALATTQILGMILQQDTNELADDMINRGIKETKLPQGIDLELLHGFPETPGVYYFNNEYGKVVYVGKSINIRSRVLQHFGAITAKSEKMMRLVKDISYEETGSELIALLLESEEIKSLRPEINKAQRTKEYPYVLYKRTENDGFIHLYIEKSSQKIIEKESIISYYGTIRNAKSNISGIRSEYMLCEEKIHAKGDTNTKCIYFPMGECLGACRSIEEAETYNVRAKGAIEKIKRTFDHDFIIVVNGRHRDEKGLVLVRDGMYQGYGYMNLEEMQFGIEEMLECIEKRNGTIESNIIINQYISQKKDFKKIDI